MLILSLHVLNLKMSGPFVSTLSVCSQGGECSACVSEELGCWKVRLSYQDRYYPPFAKPYVFIIYVHFVIMVVFKHQINV